MNGELPEDGADDIDVEDIGLRAFFGKAFDRLRGGGGLVGFGRGRGGKGTYSSSRD